MSGGLLERVVASACLSRHASSTTMINSITVITILTRTTIVTLLLLLLLDSLSFNQSWAGLKGLSMFGSILRDVQGLIQFASI